MVSSDWVSNAMIHQKMIWHKPHTMILNSGVTHSSPHLIHIYIIKTRSRPVDWNTQDSMFLEMHFSIQHHICVADLQKSSQPFIQMSYLPKTWLVRKERNLSFIALFQLSRFQPKKFIDCCLWKNKDYIPRVISSCSPPPRQLISKENPWKCSARVVSF